MQIRHPDVDRQKNPWPLVRKLQLLLNKDDRTIAKYMEMGLSVFKKARAEERTLPAFAICMLFERLELDPDLFFSDQLDYHLLAIKAKGGAEYLPRKYTENAFGTLATPKAFIDSLLQSHQQSQVVELLRALQISPSLLLDSSVRVNLKFSLDIFKFLDKRSKVEFFMSEFGRKSALAARPKEFDLELKAAKGFKSLFESLPHLIEKHIEKNFHYSIDRLNSQVCILNVSPREHIQIIVDEDQVAGSYLPLFCKARIPYLESIMIRGVGVRPESVTEISCIFSGAPCCRYLVEFRRPFSSLSVMEA